MDTGAMNLRKAYEQRQEARMDELKASVDKLEARARRAAADAKIEGLKRLGPKAQQARDKLDELKQAGTNAWEELRSGYEDAERELRDAIADASREVDRLLPD